MQHVRTDRDGPVGILTLAHEDENRFTTPFVSDLIEALAEFENDDTVRGVVVTAAQEKVFCTGLHLAWMVEAGESGPDGLAEFLDRFRQMLAAATGYPKPLVGAIGGHVAAAGVVFAASFDYRLMNAERGKVRLPEVHMNLEFLPGAMVLLRDILPAQSLRDMLYTGKAYTSAEAHRLGYIDSLHAPADLLPAAVSLARELGTCQLPTYAMTKRELRREVLRKMDHNDRKFIEQKIAELRAAYEKTGGE